MMQNSPTPDPRADTRALVMLLAAIFVCGAALSFDTILVVKITAFYRITDGDFGALLGFSCFLMAAASVPWGYLADRAPRVPLIRLSLALIALSLAGAAAAFFLDLPYSVYVASKVVGGIGFAGVGPIATSAIMDAAPLKQRGAAYGWVGVAWALGGAAGMAVPAVCMAQGLGLGLTHALVAAAVLAFAAALGLVPEPRRGAHDQALADTVGAGADYAYTIKPADLRPLLARPVNLILVAAMFLFQIPIQTLAVWFVTFLMRNQGEAEFAATAIMIVAFLGQPFGNAAGGILIDRAFRARRSGRTRVMTGMAVAAPVFLAAAFLLPFHLVPFVVLMIAANFFLVASGPGLTTVSLEVNLPEHRGTISALMAVCSNLSRAAGWYLPPLIAAAFAGRYDRAFLVTAVAYLPLIALYLLLGRRVTRDLDFVDQMLGVRAKTEHQNETCDKLAT